MLPGTSTKLRGTEDGGARRKRAVEPRTAACARRRQRSATLDRPRPTWCGKESGKAAPSETRWQQKGGPGAVPGPPSTYCYSDFRISRMSSAVSLGVLPTLTPAASRASFFAAAVPAEPETIAPAWPIVLPSGAVKPAT